MRTIYQLKTKNNDVLPAVDGDVFLDAYLPVLAVHLSVSQTSRLISSPLSRRSAVIRSEGVNSHDHGHDSLSALPDTPTPVADQLLAVGFI